MCFTVNNNFKMLEEDLQILIDQTGISRDLAKRLLIQKKGDLVESILAVENSTSVEEMEETLQNEVENICHANDDAEKPIDLSSQDNLKEYREIVDEKDVIYNRKKKENEERKKKAEAKILKGETEEVTEKPMCNEMTYYATRKNNINSIKVL